MRNPARHHQQAIDKRRRDFALLSIALLIAAAVAASFIDFPPGDSWTHGWTVQSWLDGKFVLNQWVSTLALPQQILGWLVNFGAKAVMWSRLSVMTAVVTVLGILLAARLPARLFPQWPQLKEWAPLFAIVALAPTFTLKVATGFMTDGYYLFFLTSSLWLLLGILNEPDQSNASWIRRWVGFAALGTLAALQRTHGLVLLSMVGIWVLFAKAYGKGESKVGGTGWRGWRRWFAIGVCAIGFILSLAIIQNPALRPTRALEVTQDMIRFWRGQEMPLDQVGLDRIRLIFRILQHLGLALLPLALIARLDGFVAERKSGKRAMNWWYILGGTVFLLYAIRLYVTAQELFPYLGNSLTPEGFGPRADTIALTAGHMLPEWERLLLTLAGTIGGMVLIWILSRTVKIRAVDWRAPSTLIGLLGVVHLGLVFLTPDFFFDRYLLPLLPFAFCWLALVLKDIQPKARLIGWMVVIPLLVWSIWGTADALDWTKSKWDLAAELRSRGVAANEIVGGYEVDGFYNYSGYAYHDPNRPVTRAVRLASGFWWIDDFAWNIRPVFVIVEKGAKIEGTRLRRYRHTGIMNDRMEVLAAPGVDVSR